MPRKKMTKRAATRGQTRNVKKTKATKATKTTKAVKATRAMKATKAVKATKAPKAKKANNASIIQKMEKEFLQAPAKIAAQINKDLKVLKQKESKIVNAANKNSNQVQAAEKKLIAADKASHTSAGKKRFNVAKKKHAAVIKAREILTKQVDEITSSIAAVNDKQAKFTAIAKQLTQLDKEWAKNSKKNLTATKSTSKTPNRRQKDIEIPNNIATIDRPQADDAQTLFDEISLDESTEKAVG